MAESSLDAQTGIDRILTRAILQSSSTKRRINELDELQTRFADGSKSLRCDLVCFLDLIPVFKNLMRAIHNSFSPLSSIHMPTITTVLLVAPSNDSSLV